jgi:YVTN family beta-propeller protein
MKFTLIVKNRASLLIHVLTFMVLASRLIHASTGSCGDSSVSLPFTDVQSSNIFFCSIAQAYFSGLTNGTSPTAYNPSDPVPREQMAAFITRTQDSALIRGSRRAALQQWWTPTEAAALRSVSVFGAFDIVCDGPDLWVSGFAASGTVKRIRASDGQLLQTWTGANLLGLIAAAGRIFVVAQTSPGKIYVINPEAPPGPVTVFENDIGANPVQITYDGANLWTANFSGSISRVNVATVIDSTFSAGFSLPNDILWDGSNLWVADAGDNKLKRIDQSTGGVVESITVGTEPRNLLFDGTNIWVSNASSDSISIVRAVGALRGTVLTTLTGNGLGFPLGMAFDGERVFVCNNLMTVSLFKAADLSPLGTLSTQSIVGGPAAACSDGVSFWFTDGNSVVRF